MIRPYRTDDFEPVTRFWFDAMEVAMPGLEARLGHTLQVSRDYFSMVILFESNIWVYEAGGNPIGFLSIKGEFIDRLYVDPAHHRRDVGQALMDHAKTLSPTHLWLYTHVGNKIARAFYEKNGFVAERFGISPAPESEPDVEYHWRGKAKDER